MHPCIQLNCFQNFSTWSCFSRWAIWLKCWSADQTSYKGLSDLPFQGKQLFGSTLDDIIKAPFFCNMAKAKTCGASRDHFYLCKRFFFCSPSSSDKGSNSFNGPSGFIERTWPHESNEPATSPPWHEGLLPHVSRVRGHLLWFTDLWISLLAYN